MAAEDVPARAAKAGQRLSDALANLPAVVDVRGAGLLVAAELAPGLDAVGIARDCLEHGLVVNAVTPTALRLTPSLLISDAELDEGVAILAGALDRQSRP